MPLTTYSQNSHALTSALVYLLPASQWASPGAQTVKNLPAMQQTRVRSLGQEDPLEEGLAAHPSVPAWRTPWADGPAGCSPRGRRVGPD